MSAEALRERRSLVGEFRRREVLVPVVDGSLLSVEAGGIRWLFAFTDVPALERFVEVRGEAVPDWVPVYGARLLDQVIPAVDGPVGIAVDAGSPTGFVLPPVTGIVPDAVALDSEGAGA
ncbi:SseB family protein [Streptomyces canus]|uniref:SseB family protein n=1 Tax=Streptomyces canus TaxID=58343 RepID=UPI0033EDC12A